MMEYIGIIMFFVALAMLLFGYPVAFTFGGVAVIFGVMAEGWDLFAFMPFRIYSIMQNVVLMAVPLFIFMGVVLQRTRLAEQLLESMGRLFGDIRGGLAVSTILVGALLAASTGVVGASVVAMGVISLPVMLRLGYRKTLACGAICSAGTLGQIIPPSIILIILGDVLGLPVGDLFRAALLPGLVLVGVYVAYVLGYAYARPEAAPTVRFEDDNGSPMGQYLAALRAIIPPLTLIIIVLGSIFSGIATPTESSALGGIGAVLLARLTKAPMIPMAYAASSAKLWNSWDRFMLPKPFSRVVLRFGDMIRLAPIVNENGFEEQRQQLEQTMRPALVGFSSGQ